MPFQEPILGGQNAIIREEIKSPNYVAGSAGWSLDKDGDAEFNSVVVRGTIEADGSQGSYIKVLPGVLVPRIEFRGRNSSLTSTIEGDGDLELTGATGSVVSVRTSSPFPAISNSIALDTLSSGGNIFIQSPSTVFIGGTMQNDADNMVYRRGLLYTALVSNASATAFTVNLNFPTAFPIGVTPFVFVNLSDSSGATLRAIVSAYNESNTGFTLRVRSGDGTTMGAWSNVKISVQAFV